MTREWSGWETSEFQIGDTVVLSYNPNDAHMMTIFPKELLPGSIGVIKGHSKNGFAYAVEFDRFVEPGRNFYGDQTLCCRLCELGCGWWVKPEYLSPASGFNETVSVEEFL